MKISFKRILPIFILFLLMFSTITIGSGPDISNLIDIDDFINMNKQKHVTLLAVHETEDGYQGSFADISIELRHGTGRVFLDTFPLSKIDTQISTRFAKDIACKYIGHDCPDNDFIYTIRSDSSIVGGPSAGGAIAVLTVAQLKNFELNPKVAITGTINSGGIIGPVSGLKYKIDIAAKNGFEKVLIPMDTLIIDQNNNITYTAAEYSEIANIDVVEVSDLDDALYEFTGERTQNGDDNIDLPDTYKNTMRGVASELCNRSSNLYQIMKDQFEITKFDEDATVLSRNLEDEAVNLTARAEAAMDAEQYYSAASYCYGANIKYSNVILLQRNQEGKQLSELILEVEDNIFAFKKQLTNITYQTLTDFEVSMIIKERIQAAEDFLNNAKTYAEDENTKYSAYYNLAYSLERLHTSSIWSHFFGMQGQKITITQSELLESCKVKLSEAQERVQYIKLFIPEQMLLEISNDMARAFDDYQNGDFELCISKASRAKASANVLMSLMTSDQKGINNLLQRKLEAARKVIIKEQEKGIFPILGYSYYEYASSMQNSDPLSALIYAESALELSWLDIYFTNKSTIPKLRINPVYALLIMVGFLLGATFMLTFIPKRSKILKRRKRRKI